MTTDNRVHFRLSERTHDWLKRRSDLMHTGRLTEQAQLELGLWQSALQVELRRIRLTLAQANCVADVLNGSLMSPGIATSVPLVYAEVSDAFQLARADHLDGAGYGAKWGVDEEALLGYLRTLGPVGDHALHDAVARWWDTSAEPTSTGWASVGLNVTAPADEEA